MSWAPKVELGVIIPGDRKNLLINVCLGINGWIQNLAYDSKRCEISSDYFSKKKCTKTLIVCSRKGFVISNWPNDLKHNHYYVIIFNRTLSVLNFSGE